MTAEATTVAKCSLGEELVEGPPKVKEGAWFTSEFTSIEPRSLTSLQPWGWD